MFHGFLGEKLPDWKAAASLVRKIAENYKLPYYTISPTYSVCREHGYLSGEHFICPKCGKKAEVYSRITGYYRPVQNWNDGKAQEYKNRKLYDPETSVCKHGAPVQADAARSESAPSGFVRPESVSSELVQSAEPAMVSPQEHYQTDTVSPVQTSFVTITKEDVTVTPVAAHKYLFTTSSCPNCRIAKNMLAGEDYEVIEAEKHPDLVEKYGILQAPTLVVTDGEHLTKYVNASNIRRYVDTTAH